MTKNGTGMLLKKCFAVVLTLFMMTAEVPPEIFAAGGQSTDYPILLNGSDCAAANAVSVAYGDSVTLSLSGYSGSATPAFTWLPASEQPDGAAQWSDWTSSAPTEPGSYYLGYNFTDSDAVTYTSDDGSYRFAITKAQPAAPAGLRWQGGAASWSAVTQSTTGSALAAGAVSGYTVTLYKNGAALVSNDVTAAACDFTSRILASGKGLYTFDVRADVTDTAHYAASEVSARSGAEAAVLVAVTAGEGTASVTPSAAQLLLAGDPARGSISLTAALGSGRTFAGWSASAAGAVVFADASALSTTATLAADYAGTELTLTAATSDTEKPTISAYAAGTGDDYGTLQGTAADSGSAITQVAFSTAAAAADVAAADWQTAPENGAGVPVSVSHAVTAAGTYYFYVKDAAGNTARSDAGIRASEVDYSGYYENGTADAAHRSFLVGDAPLVLSVPSRPGFSSSGWHLRSDCSDGAITSISAHSDSAITVYTRWTRQQISIIAQPQDYSGTYDGAAHTLSVSVGNAAGAISYQWYKTVGGNSQPIDGATAAQYSVKNVADSGSYFVRVTILLEGGAESTDSNAAAVSIEPRPLTVTADAKRLTYGDAVPENFYTYQAAGFAEGEDASVLTAGALTCAYAAGSAAGSYPIAGDGFAAANYAVAVTAGTLTVAPKDGAAGEGMACVLESDQWTYTGAAVEPSVTVTDGGGMLTAGTDYTVSYSNNLNVGTGSATVTFAGNYTGSRVLSFAIVPATFTADTILADWVYGDTPGTPDVSTNPSGGAPAYYYYAAGKTAADATTAQPTRAGSYCVYAVIPAAGNYRQVTTAVRSFSILKRPVTLIAASRTWEYDGNSHTAASYTRTGSLVGSDAFQSVSVAGSITAVGTAENVISYRLTSATDAGNYDITAVSGTLTVTSRALTVPTDCAWKTTAPGTAAWVAVTRDGLTVAYNVELWRTSNNVRTKVRTVTASSAAYDFADIIRADAAANGVAGYSFCVTAVPAGGSNLNNYTASSVSDNSAVLYTASVSVSGGSGVASAAINGAQSAILLQNETASLTATAQSGYSFSGSVWSEVSGNLTIADASKAQTTAVLSSKLAGPAAISVAASCSDDLPVITGFSAAAYDGNSKVRFTFSAADTKMLTGWALTDSGTEQPAASDWHAIFTSALNNQTVDGITEADTYYVWVRDDGGNVVCSAANESGPASIDVYRISFAAGENGSGNMVSILKVENTAVTLPVSTFTRSGYSFRNWKGTSGIYADGGSYGANASDTLTVQWTDEQFAYTVNYYLMDTAGSYAADPSQTAQFSGAYGAVVSSGSAAVALTLKGMELDADRPGSITLTEDGLTLSVYYRRLQYTVSYSYSLADGTPRTAQQTYYYGAPFTELAKPRIDGYAFVGWVYGGSGKTPQTMPNNNLTATGSFVPANASYVIHCYLQNIPADSSEAPSYALAQERDITVAALQGDRITFGLSDADVIEGFTAAYVTISSGEAGGSVPGAQTTTAAGTVSSEASAALHVNVYYARNTYQLTLNVYDSNLRTGKLYTHTESRLYGEAIDAAAFAVYGQADWPAAPDGSTLAAYADWSTGAAPAAMPAGDVSVARDYVKSVEVPYRIEVYYESATEGSYALQSTLTYYGYAGAAVTVGGTDDDTVNYNTFSSSVYGFAWYQFDSANAGNVLSATVRADGTTTLRAYFARRTFTATVTYYYNSGTASDGNIKLATVTKTGKWGTNFAYQPLALFSGSLPDEWSNNGSYTANDSKAGTFDFKANGYTASYAGYYWSDGNHWPSFKYTTAASLTDRAGDTGPFGRGDNTTLSVYYVKVDHDTHYTVDMAYNPAKLSKAGDATDHSLLASVAGESCKVRLANEADIYESTWVPSASAEDIAAYPALAYTGGSYSYGDTPTLRSGFTAVTVSGSTYYLNAAQPGYVYVADAENQFYYGNRVGYNFLADELNAAKLGYDSVESYLAGYKTAHGDSAGVSYDAKASGAYIYNGGFSPIMYGDGTYRFTFDYADTYTVTYTMGGKSCSDHTYVKDQLVNVGCDNRAAFPEKSGYVIQWYTDSACTVPAADFRITQSTILYGSYVRATVTYTVNCYYQLPDGTTVTDPGADGLTTQTSSETVSFTDGTGAAGDYSVPVTKYYRGGELVMATRRYPALSYSEVALNYDRYLIDAFVYDDANTGNAIKGYCEASGITLSAYYAREKHTLAANAGNTPVETVTTATYLAGQSAALGVPVRAGYAFAGWTLQKWDGSAWAAWTDAPQAAADGADFAMPNADVQAAAAWNPANCDSTVVHYFETTTRTYAADLYASLAGMTGETAAVIFGGTDYADARVYLEGSTVLGASLVLDGRTWYFSAAASAAQGAYTVDVADLIAVSEPITALSESTLAVSARVLDLSACPMYSFAYAQLRTEDSVTALAAADTFVYGPTVSLACYYAREADFTVALAAESADGGDSGLTLTGGSAACSYGETMTVRAAAAAGYTFVGWYSADDDAFVSPISTDAEYSFRVTENRSLVALSRPSAAAQPTVTLSGPVSYNYGYSAARTNAVTASVAFAEGTDSANKVVSYQWYEITGGSASAIAGATSATCLFPTGKVCGSYTYRCDVVVQRSDNGRAVTVQSEPFTVTVSPANMTVEVAGYTGTYDAADHGITVTVRKPAAGSYEIYYADSPLTADNYTQGSAVNPVYRNVRMDGGTVGSYTVYYYIRNTDGNYTDLSGSAPVTIKPIPVTLQADGSFHKTYDGTTAVGGSVIEPGTEKYELSRGTSYTIIGLLKSEADLYIADFDADFDSKDVKSAGSLTMRDIRIVSGTSGAVDYNYSFADNYTLSLSGYITPYVLPTVWDSETSFVYDGTVKAPGLHLSDTAGIPEPSIADGLTVQGGQVNAGSYTAYAAITASEAYELSNYSFSSGSRDYTIAARPITLTPDVSASGGIVYDGAVHTVTGFIVGGSGLAAPDGVQHTFTAETDTGAVGAGTTAVTARNMHIFQGATDVTDDYAITYGSADLVIAKAPVRISGFTAADKPYDGGTAAVIGVGGLSFSGIVPGDHLEIPASGVTGSFSQSGVGTDLTVTAALEESDLAGSSAANYRLDLAGSELTCLADITPAAVTVTAGAAAVTYGEPAAFSATFAGFVDGEDQSVVSGSVGYSVSAGGGAAAPYTVSTPAGSYAILPDISGLSAANYTFTAVPGELTVAKRPLAVTAAPEPTVTKVYDGTTAAAACVGGDDWTFAATGASASGIANGDAVGLRFDAVYDSKDVSDARTVTLSNLRIDNENYALATDTVAITAGCSIRPRALTITADNKTATYGAAAPAFTAAYAGFAGSEDKSVLGGSLTFACAYDTGNSASRSAGSYAIAPSGLTSGNYTITFVPGTLTVGKALLTAAAQAATITYGEPSSVPAYTSALSGFRYGEDAGVVSGTLTTACGKTVNDLPGTYANAILPDTAGLSADNYTFRAVGAALTIERRELTVSGIRVNGKVYDATTAVAAGQIDLSAVVYDGILEGDAGNQGLAVTGTYASANVGEDINVALAVRLNSYLAARYTLAGASQSTAAADITARPLTVTVNSQTIRYGDAEPAYSVRYSGFAGSETASVLSGQLAYTENYTADAGSGSYSAAGSYPVAASGLSGGNYAITYAPGTLTVSPARLSTPAVSWSATPGTVSWTAVPGIGAVPVGSYTVSLIETGTGMTVQTQTEPAGTTGCSFLEAMRVNGAGSYQVQVTAIASADGNADKCNVADSAAGASGSEKAARVSVQFAADAVSQAAAAVMSGSDPAISIHDAGLASYTMIAGESGAAIAAHLKNATGYSVSSLSADSTALTLTSPVLDTAGTTVSANAALSASLASTAPIAVTLTMRATPATVTLSLSADPASATFGYTAEAAPRISAAAAPEAGDNLAASGYTYTYQWYLKDGSAGVNTAMADGTGATVVFPTGKDAGNNRYKVTCQVTATRSDNGQSKTITSISQLRAGTAFNVVIERAQFSASAVLAGWTYGAARGIPAVTANPGSAAVVYEYNTDAAASTGWTTEIPKDAGTYYVRADIAASANYQEFMTKSLQFVIAPAKLATPENLAMDASPTAPYGLLSWDAVSGPEENAGNAADSTVSVRYRVRLYRAETDSAADADWTQVGDAQETDATSLDLTGSFLEKGFYRFTVQALAACSNGKANCADSDESARNAVALEIKSTMNDGSQSYEYTKVYDGKSVVLSAGSGVTGVTGYQWLRNNAAVAGATADTLAVAYVEQSGTYTCQLTLSDGSSYYSSNRVITVTPLALTVTSATRTKIYDGTPLAGQTESVVSALGTGADALGEGDSIAYTLGSRTDAGTSTNSITGVTITHNAGAAGEKTVFAEGGTNNNYTLTKTTGSLTVTARSLADGAGYNAGIAVSQPDAVTYDGTHHTPAVAVTDASIRIGAADKLLTAGTDYTLLYAGNLHAGTATVTITGRGNYTGVITRTFVINRRPVTLTAASAARTYNGTALTAASCAPAAGFALGSGDSIDAASVRCSGAITDVGSTANAITAVILRNAGGTDVTADYDLTYAPGVLTINVIAAPITITANSAQKTYDGAALTDGGCTYTTGVLITGDVLTATVSGSRTNAGTSPNVVTAYTVTRGSTDVTADYTFADSVPGTLTIDRRPLTLTSASGSKTYDGTALQDGTVTVTGSGFADGEGADFTVTGTILDKGSVSNAFTYALHTDMLAANYDITCVFGTLTINAIAAPITITANSAEKTYDGSALTDGGCTYTTGVLLTGDELTATVSGSRTNAGTGANVVTAYTVTRGSTDVTADYTFADSVPGTLRITPKDVTITVDSAGKTYGETDPAFTGAVNGLVAAGDLGAVTYRRTNSAVGDAGNYAGVLTANYTPNANYTVRITAGDFVIRRAATLTVAGASYSAPYDGAAHGAAAAANVSAGTLLQYSTDGGASWSGSFPTITDVGTVYVTVRAANANYETAQNTYTLTVSQKAARITVNSASKVYGSADPAFAGVVEGLVSSGDLGTVTYRRTNSSVNAVGSYADVLTADYTANANYSVTLVRGSFDIVRSSGLTISNPGYNGTYDGAAHGAAAAVNIAGGTAVAYSTDGGVSWSDAVPTLTRAGTLTVRARATNSQYVTAVCIYTLTLARKQATVTVSDAAKTYGGNDPAFTGTVDGLVAAGDLGAVTYRRTNSGVESAAAYTDALTADYTENPDYAVRVVNGTFTINPADLTPAGAYVVTAPADTLYNGSEQALDPVVTTADGAVTLLKDRDYTVSRSGDLVNAGSVAITVTGIGNYTGLRTASYAITPRSVTLTSATSSRQYHRTPRTDDGITIGGDGFADGESVVCTVTGSQLDCGSTENVFTFAPGAGTLADNYTITAANGRLTVTQVSTPITVAAASAEKTYDGTALTDGGCTYTTGVLVAGDVLTATVSGSQTNAGSSANTVTGYRVTRGSTDVTANYTFADSASGLLTVLQANGAVAITLPLGKQYDGRAADAAAAVTQTGDGALSFQYYRMEAGVPTELAGAPKDAGSYRAIASAAASVNYTAAVSAPVDFTITPRPITVTAADAQGAYGTEPPTLRAAVTSPLGVCAGDDLHIGAQTVATSASPVGSYAITPFWDDTLNYAVTPVSGTYTVVEAAMPFTAVGSTSVYDGAAHGVDVTGPQGMTVYYGTSELTAGNYRGAGTEAPSYTNAGSYTVWYYITADNYADVAGSVQVEISRAAQIITAADVSAVYDGTAHSVTATVNTGNPVSYENNGRVAAGSSAVTIRVAGNENYLDAVATVTITVARRNITLTAGSASKPADGSPLTCGDYALTAGSLAAGDRVAAVTIAGSITAAGTAANVINGARILNAAGGDVTDSYALTAVNGLLTVTAAGKTAGAADGVPDESITGDKTFDVGTGRIRVTVDCRNADGSRLDGRIASSQQVVGATATGQELDDVRNGETLEIRLRVSIDDDTAAAEKAAGRTVIKGRADGDGTDRELTLGTYADLSLEKRIGQAEWTRLLSSDEAITVTIRIPDELVGKGGAYYIAVPGGDGYTLLRDEDSDPDTITFTTEIFDNCAIAYSPAGIAASDSFILFNFIAMLLCLALGLLCLLKKKKLRIPAAAAAVAAVVVWLLRFSRGRIVLFDRWSILFAALLLAEIWFFARRDRKQKKDRAAAK
ncbi:MAG: MBG domain-containing protein [Oscillospiraceae bacterium]|nr:MBG domain-containing protein [Oscillospiraceae bacterium]